MQAFLVAGEDGFHAHRADVAFAARHELRARRCVGGVILGDLEVLRSKEAREELEDALVYLACAWLKTETHNLEVV